MRRKDGSDDDRPPEDWRGEPRSNDTHQSTSDPESRLYRKSHAAPALPSYLGHVLTDLRHGLVVNVQASTSDGTAERGVAAQMLADVAGAAKRVTVGADKAYDAKGFVKACVEINVAPHVAQNINAMVAAPSTAAPPAIRATRSASARGSASSSASAGAR